MRVKPFAAILSLCLIVLGCGAARPSKYYQLNVPGDSVTAAASDPYRVTLMLGPITSSHIYREDHIVYSGNGGSIGTYQYQRWAQPPTEMIEEVLLRNLRSSNRFQDVYAWGSGVHGDYILRGRLYDFREVSTPALLARVTLELELHDARTGATVWSHFYTRDEPVAGKDVSAVVAALDRNLNQGIGDFEVSLGQYFSTHAPSNASPGQ
jgi:ABC-type uncharacterized transport system auxiliary subunit